MKYYEGLVVPCYPNKEWTWMKNTEAFCTSNSEYPIQCHAIDCDSCIYAKQNYVKRLKFYKETFNKENKEMNKKPKLKNFDLVELDLNKTSEKYAIINADDKTFIYIDSFGVLRGYDHWEIGVNKLDWIKRVWRFNGIFNGNIVTGLIDAIEQGLSSKEICDKHLANLVWEKEEELKEVTMEELNKLLKENGLAPVKIKE